MRNPISVRALGSVVVLGLLLAGAGPVAARDLVKTTAALVLAEEPPPSRSQVLEEERKKQAALEAVAKKKEAVNDTPYYKRWWFWALTGVVVGGTVAGAFWATDTSRPPAKACQPGVIACFGDGRR